jgi:hypothetical protein
LLALVFGRRRAENPSCADNDLQYPASGEKAVDYLEEVQARYNEMYGWHQLAFMKDKQEISGKPYGKNTLGFYDWRICGFYDGVYLNVASCRCWGPEP